MYNVFMSATVADVDVFCHSLHLDRSRTKVIELADTFPVEHRPVVPWPIVRVNKKSIDENPDQVYGSLVDALDEIASAYYKHRILVHTSSYVFGAELIKRVGVIPGYRVLAPRDGVENKAMIARYTNRADSTPYVLISPACREGYDFEGDLCRVQVFMKCPFPSLGDPVVALKLKASGGGAWYAAKVATAIRQQYGRSTRNPMDFSVTFLLDTALIEFIEKNRKLFPKEFHQAMDLGKQIDWRRLDITHQLEIDSVKVSY